MIMPDLSTKYNKNPFINQSIKNIKKNLDKSHFIHYLAPLY
jgi:hypothetical protein